MMQFCSFDVLLFKKYVMLFILCHIQWHQDSKESTLF